MATAPVPPTPDRPAGSPPIILKLLGLTTYVGLAGFAVVEVVQILTSGTAGLLDASLLNALTWLAGVNSIIIGSGHLTFPDPIAESIGWPAGSPFQWEVGLAGLVVGVLGVMSSGFGREFQLAAVIAFAIFYLGAAVGHVKQMVVERNFAAGNAGFIFWYDIAAPVLVIALYIATA